MRISPVSYNSFGRKANQEEIKQFEQNLSSARKSYTTLEKIYIYNIPEGYTAMKNAEAAGKRYTQGKCDEEKRIIYDYINYFSPNLCSKETAKKEEERYTRAKGKVDELRAKGEKEYFNTHIDEKRIISNARKEFRKTKTGIDAIERINGEKDKLNRARKGEDVETIV